MAQIIGGIAVSLEDFMKTRNTKVIYSVTGNEAAKAVAWDTQD